jgi:ADP-heptose:LPS heptosyltransferase
MKEKRGSTLLKRLDRYVGGACLAILMPLLWLLSILRPGKQANPNVYLVVCIGAIGDLILLTEAVRSQLQGKQVFLACSKSNLTCARMYNDVYAGIDVINIRSLLDVYRICMKRDVDTVYDSTQWANIGPVQTGLARLLKRGLVSVGFRTDSLLRNGVYSYLVSHGSAVHETANFINLLAGRELVQANNQLKAVLSSPYQQSGRRDKHKVLLHMWPSGARAYLKEWPESYWIELAGYFVRMGYRVYLSGAPVDKPRNDAFIRKAGLSDLVNIAGAYDLSALSVFVRDEIECAVSVNTGVLHLVASLGVPIIGLHGPTNPVRWGPLGVNAVSLLPESGNFAYLNYGFEYPADDADAYALDQLKVQQVIDAFEQFKRIKS